ncbi:hypothetical protein HMF8227_01455 [Saliniradius amylolyticus]|uniref:Uncharacterized protein n=1 Tax=Saliniradius amylolyticus TaxID=2183582 RepID=A0A2S2E3V1_9ALTE|nr:hypothetical protein [Saliniradius amylolyticus]AWL11930.1 hypothetical protein HMF8227_01455 [Saliniradius amylolyticus]
MKRIQLTKEAKKLLKPALWGNAEKEVFREIERGISRLYITHSRDMLAVIRFEAAEMVVVAVAGRNLRQNRGELIDFARGNDAMTIRFHTRAPEHLKKGLSGLPIVLSEVRKRLLGRDEYVFKLGVNNVQY